MSSSPRPTDWSNPAGWDKYYSELIATGDYAAEVWNTGTISVNRVAQLISELRSKSFLNVWLPGCGISLMPRLLCRGGLRVHATDISGTAIQFQNTANTKVDEMILAAGVDEAAGGAFTAEVHDFRTHYVDEKFELIINVKAFQAFPAVEMRKIADVHFDALKPGGQAIFDTLNVQGERREMVEAALVDAGFYLPFYEATVEYRRRLNETDIPYTFVLGQPIIPAVGEYGDRTKRDLGTSVLREISAEYVRQIDTERKSVTEHYRDYPETKTVSVFYSTG